MSVSCECVESRILQLAAVSADYCSFMCGDGEGIAYKKTDRKLAQTTTLNCLSAADDRQPSLCVEKQ